MSNSQNNSTAVVPSVEMDFDNLHAKYAMLIDRELSKALNYPEAVIPPPIMNVLNQAMKTLTSIQAEKRAADKDKEELTYQEKVALLKQLVESEPELKQHMLEEVKKHVNSI